MRYEIDDNNAVLCYVGAQETPVLFQPYDPSGDGKPFKSKADSEKWAKSFVKDWEAEQVRLAALPDVVPVEPAV
jgi:hypothetical protein